MNRKTLGIIIMVIGVGITLYSGFNSVTSQNVIYVKAIELKADKENNINWSSFAGIAVYIIGGVFYFAERKKTATQDRHLDIKKFGYLDIIKRWGVNQNQ